TVEPPDRQHDPVPAERPEPAQRVLVVRVDERPVDIEDGRARYDAVASTLPNVRLACCSCRPSANSSTIFEQNAGRSSGLRLVTMPASTTTSWSTRSPPAFRMSVVR